MYSQYYYYIKSLHYIFYWISKDSWYFLRHYILSDMEILCRHWTYSSNFKCPSAHVPFPSPVGKGGTAGISPYGLRCLYKRVLYYASPVWGSFSRCSHWFLYQLSSSNNWPFSVYCIKIAKWYCTQRFQYLWALRSTWDFKRHHHGFRRWWALLSLWTLLLIIV